MRLKKTRLSSLLVDIATSKSVFSLIKMIQFMRDEYDFDGARNNPYSSRQQGRQLDLTAWQVKEIKQALKEADSGEFVPATVLSETKTKYPSQAADESSAQSCRQSRLRF